MYILRFFLVIIFFIGLSRSSFCQNIQKIDSLKKKLEASEDDTNKVNLLNHLSWELKSTESEKAINTIQQALKLAEKLNYSKGIANSWNNLGVIYYSQGDYNLALEYLTSSLKILSEINDQKGMAKNYNNIGNIYRIKGDNKLALENHLKGLKIREDIKDKTGMSSSYNNIGLIYQDLQEYNTALDYFLKSAKIKEELNDRPGLPFSYTNIGNIFSLQKKYPLAIEFQRKAQTIFKELNDQAGVALTYNNLGTIYEETNRFSEALDLHFKSLKIKEQLSDQSGIATSLINIANIYEKQQKPNEAVAFRNKALEVSNKIGFKEGIKNAYIGLSSSYEEIGKHEEALKYYKLFTSLKDSIFNEEKAKAITQIQAQFDSEKQAKEIELLRQENTIKELQVSKQETELKKEKQLRYSVLAGLALLIILGGVLFSRYKIKQSASAKLEAAYHQIEEKNKDITDSIRYAQNIQQAILPDEKELKEYLPDSFILFKPKDIVSGDFYYFEPIQKELNQNSKFVIAAADCTGHGVPGAFMSIVGYHVLKQSIREYNRIEPSDILNELNTGVNETLHQTFSNTTIKDGMDIGLCTIDLAKKSLSFSGANSSLYFIRNNELMEIKGNKFPIGANDSGETRKFTTSNIDLSDKDCFYLFSDGFADQFGGPKGKKLKYKQFKEFLLSIYQKPMQEQKSLLDELLSNWKGELEQVDDILIIGMRV